MSVTSTSIPFARARFTHRSASWTCQALMRRRLGSSELQPSSIRAVRRPAAPSFPAISARLASLWLQVQWN